jgi:long-chain acyl-CoA synthetase
LNTFAKLLRYNAAVRGGRPAMRHKNLGVWESFTWARLFELVLSLAQGLKSIGVRRGDRIAVIGGNRPAMYWTISAAQVIGALPVPVYADSAAEEIAYVLDHAGARVAAVQDQEQVDKLLPVWDRLPNLARVIYDEVRGLLDYDDARLSAILDLIENGRRMRAEDPAVDSALEADIAAGTADDPSIILYTSGTAGRSKGVVLTAGRSIEAARDTVAFDHLCERDRVFAYLPIAWVGDHYMNYAQSFVAGFCMACPESEATVEQDLREIGPTFHFAPPRVFEALLTRIMIRMADASPVKRRVFDHFLMVAKKWGTRIVDRKPVPWLARLHYGLGDLLVYGPLKNTLGFSCIRVAYTAGEAIGADLFSFYRSIGLNLKQLYGQTEAFLYVTCQADGSVRSDAVGRPAPNVLVRISENGEVQYRSPGRFAGYYKDERKTSAAVTDDGFIKTGDAGYFDTDGQLKIIDRVSDVGRLRNGTLFAPKYLENKLKFFPDIKEAVAFGNGRDFVACFLNIELASVADWAERNRITFASYQELALNERVGALLERHVDAVNRALSHEPNMAGAQIRRFLILHKELDADEGELTRTQKVRRTFIGQKYSPLVEALFNHSKEATITTEINFEDGRKGTTSARIRIVDLPLHIATEELA